MRQVSAVIFDMDGLMLDTEKVYYRINAQTAKELGFNDFTPEFYEQFIGSGNDLYRKGIYEQFNDDQLATDFLELADQRLEYALLNEPIDKKPGLIHLLEYLQEEDIPAVVASSTNRQLVDGILAHTDLRPYFKAVVGGDEVPTTKPEPDIFLKATEYIEFSREEILVLEDSLNGVRAAEKAGMRVVMVPDIIEPDEEAHAKALAVLDDLFEVTALIQKSRK